jgi:ferredoxin-type protein NapH
MELIEVLKAIMVVGIVIAGIMAIVIGIKDLTKRMSCLRLYIQIVAVIVIFWGLVVGPFGVEQFPPVGIAPRDTLIGTNIFGASFPDGLSVPTMACYYPSGRTMTCVIWQIQSYIFPFWTSEQGWGVVYSNTGLERLAIALGLIIVMSIVLGRFFCGWICPFGLYMDLITRLRKTLKMRYRKFSENLNDGLRQSRYVIIAIFLIISFIIGAKAIIGIEFISETEYGTYLREYLSNPFCRVCPMNPLSVLIEGISGFMSVDYIFYLTTGQLYHLGWYVNSLNMFALGAVTAGAFAVRRFWCRFCPLGGLIAIFNRFTPFKWVSIIRLNKVEEKCTKCGICERVCPTQVKEVYEEKGGDVTSSGCMLCFRCVEMCPYEDCLKINVAGKSVFKSKNWLKH